MLAHSKGVIVSICKNLELYQRVVNTFLIKLCRCSVEAERALCEASQGSRAALCSALSEQTPLIVFSNCFGCE